MKKKNNFLIIVIIVLSLLVGVLGSFIIFDKIYKKDKVKEENSDLNEQLNDENKILNNSKYYGTYIVKFNEDYDDKGVAPSSLTLNSNNTFLFVWNICRGMTVVKGDYIIVDNKIILSNLTSEYDQETLNLNLEGKTSLEFIIVSENEIYLDFDKEMFACTITGNQNGSFIK